MGRSEVSTTVVKWSEGLSYRVSVIIRRYIDCMSFAALWLFRSSFIFLWFCFVSLVVRFVCFYGILWIMYFCCYAVYSYCYVVPFCVFRFIMLLCVLFVCNCVLYYCNRLSTQLQLTNKSYHIYIYIYIYIYNAQQKNKPSDLVWRHEEMRILDFHWKIILKRILYRIVYEYVD